MYSPQRRENQSIEEIDRVITDCGVTKDDVTSEANALESFRQNPFTSIRHDHVYTALVQPKGVALGSKRVISGSDFLNFFDSDAKAKYLHRNLEVTHFVNHKIGRPQPWRQLKANEEQRHARIFLAWKWKNPS